MNPLRTQVKFFLEDSTGVDQSLFMGVFQRWIQRKALEGQLIDVADYRHVWEGPGILLVAHDSDYSMETRDSRLGLLYTRKRQVEPDLAAQLRASLRMALTACQLLEKERIFFPKLKFRADEIEIRFPDRLLLPNTPESFEIVKDDLGTILTELYGADPVDFAPVAQDKRYLFTIKVQSSTTKRVGDLIQFLQPDSAT
jgi:hypothetical protein